MITWFEVSSGATANAEVAESHTKNECNGPKHWPNLLLDNFDLSRGNCGPRP